MGVRFLLLLVMLSASAPAVRAQSIGLDRSHHPWGRFQAGSWKKVHHEIQHLDASGKVIRTSESETKSRLEEVGDKQFTVSVETRVELEGKDLQPPRQSVTQGYHGEAVGQEAAIVALPNQKVSIEGEDVECQVWQVTITEPRQTVTNKVFFSAVLSPYVLRRETTAVVTDDPAAGYETTMQVIAVEMPYRVLNDVRPAAYRRVVHKDSKGTIVTMEVVCLDVPGGIVAHTSKELDPQGRIVRRTQLELLDYRARQPNPPLSHMSRRNLLRAWRQQRRVLRLAELSRQPYCEPPAVASK